MKESFDAAHLDSSKVKHTAGTPTGHKAIINKPQKLWEGTAKEHNDITAIPVSQRPLQLLRFPLHPLSNWRPVDSLPAVVRDAQRAFGFVSVGNTWRPPRLSDVDLPDVNWL